MSIKENGVEVRKLQNKKIELQDQLNAIDTVLDIFKGKSR